MTAANELPAVISETMLSEEWHGLEGDHYERVWLLTTAIAERMGGRDVPTPEMLRRELGRSDRDARIRAQRRAGVSREALAERHRLSVRQIRRILDE